MSKPVQNTNAKRLPSSPRFWCWPITTRPSKATYEPVPDDNACGEDQARECSLWKPTAFAVFCALLVLTFYFHGDGSTKSDHGQFRNESSIAASDNKNATAAQQHHATMVPLAWDDQNQAIIEFCQSARDSAVYGYRLPGEPTCGPAGLVIRMKPGADYVLTLRNTALNETTNLHTHGLHISGAGNADDVTRTVEPGLCLTYHYSIPDNHMGGTYWLHSHGLGVTKQQIGGGAYSMLIIEETDNLLENIDESDLQALQAWMDNELLLVASENGNTTWSNGRANDPHVLELVAGEWYRLRILTIKVTGRRTPLVFPKECDVHVVAWDGVWRFDVPSEHSEHKLKPTGSGRVDVAIQCPLLQLDDDDDDEYVIAYGASASPVAIVRVAAPPAESSVKIVASPFVSENQTWQPARPYYLRDLTDGDGTVGSFERRHLALDGRTINGEQWNEELPFMTVEYNSLHEWTLNGTATHTFHLHVFHMQTFNCTGHEDGQYYDSIAATNSDCLVRFHNIDFAERVVLHCHNAGHEDEGMMVWYQVENGPIQDATGREQFTCSSG